MLWLSFDIWGCAFGRLSRRRVYIGGRWTPVVTVWPRHWGAYRTVKIGPLSLG